MTGLVVLLNISVAMVVSDRSKISHYGSAYSFTTSAGVKVTGEVNLTGELEINGTDVIDSSRNLNLESISMPELLKKIQLGADADLRIYHNGIQVTTI